MVIGRADQIVEQQTQSEAVDDSADRLLDKQHGHAADSWCFAAESDGEQCNENYQTKAVVKQRFAFNLRRNAFWCVQLFDDRQYSNGVGWGNQSAKE